MKTLYGKVLVTTCLTSQLNNYTQARTIATRSKKIVSKPIDSNSLVRAFQFLETDLEWIRLFMLTIVSSKRNHVGTLAKNNMKGSDVLDHASGYLLDSPGKMIRPALVLLLSYCCVPTSAHRRKIRKGIQNDIPILHKILKEQKSQTMNSIGDITEYSFPKLPCNFQRVLLLSCVTEFIHTASLLHDDVIDKAQLRRGKPSLFAVKGAKTSILAGDFLFSRACGLSTLLNSMPVVSLMSSALEELVRGELLQMGEILEKETYFEKNYRKTGSLLDKSLSASMILMNRSPKSPRISCASKFGSHLGQAFQIIDDCLDFTGCEETTGKPKLSDLKDGIFTLPVILAAAKDPSIKELLSKGTSPVELFLDEMNTRVQALKTVELSKEIANHEMDSAIECLRSFPRCTARDILESVARYIIVRNA